MVDDGEIVQADEHFQVSGLEAGSRAAHHCILGLFAQVAVNDPGRAKAKCVVVERLFGNFQDFAQNCLPRKPVRLVDPDAAPFASAFRQDPEPGFVQSPGCEGTQTMPAGTLPALPVQIWPVP